MMRLLTAIVGFTIIGWMAPAYSQDAEKKTAPDMENSVAQAIKQGGPVQSSGFKASVIGAIPLEGFFEALKGSNLRAREVVLLPGAKIAVHAHDKRPALVYVLEGEVVEHRSDSEEPIIRRRGDTYFEPFGVVHWLENISPNRVRVFAVDIAPSDPK